MKKIGILHGMERSFPEALVTRINEMNIDGIIAESVKIDIVEQGIATDYDVIFDRISQDVPFYRAYLKNAALSGTAVINNPFWSIADEKFFNNSLAVNIGVPVPKTVLLPSKERPIDTTDRSFSNLVFPLSWSDIFAHIGWPAFMKPHSGGGWKHVYKLESEEAFFNAYNKTDQLVMMLQEAIEFEDYFRCYCIGGKYVRIMRYEPGNEPHLRYQSDKGPASKGLLNKIEEYTLTLNKALGYDFNTVEFAVRHGIPYAIDFCNPAPDADANSVGVDNFDWVVETTAKYAIERAQSHQKGKMNLTWGSFVQQSVNESIPSVDEKKNYKQQFESAVKREELKPTESINLATSVETSKNVAKKDNTNKIDAPAKLDKKPKSIAKKEKPNAEPKAKAGFKKV